MLYSIVIDKVAFARSEGERDRAEPEADQVDELPQLVLRQRRRDGVLVAGRHAHGDLLLAHQQVGDGLGQVLHALAQHARCVANQAPQLLRARLLVQRLEQLAHRHGAPVLQQARGEVQPVRVHQVLQDVALLVQALGVAQRGQQLVRLLLGVGRAGRLRADARAGRLGRPCETRGSESARGAGAQARLTLLGRRRRALFGHLDGGRVRAERRCRSAPAYKHYGSTSTAQKVFAG